MEATEILGIILASAVGTSVMTAFSYIASESFRKLWKEPVLLNLVIAKAKTDFSPRRRSLFGWMFHYLIGVAFVFCYHLLWKYTDAAPTWPCGLLFGAVSGMVGILSWFFLFRLPDEKPPISTGQYYLQLFIAHLLFTLAVVGVYRWLLPLNFP